MILMPIIVFIVVYTIFIPTLLMFILQIDIAFFINWFEKIFNLFKVIHNYIGVIQLPTPSNVFVSIAFIIIFFIHLSSSKKLILKRLITMIIFFLFIGKLFLLSQTPTLIFLDVGQGDATVYIDKNCVVVIDAFSNVESYLRSKGKQHIDYLFLTHSDLDHVKEAKSLVENMQVKRIITSPYQEIENIQTSTIYQFPTTFFCGEIRIDILGPVDTMFDDNDDSLIILIHFLGKKILFTGDASKERERQILTFINDDIDVLKVGHHGSNTSTSSELLHALNPEFGIISTSINNRYGMPHQEVINQLKAFHIKYYITSIDGSIQMTIHQGEIKWETYPP
jgi:competence protein ComEC